MLSPGPASSFHSHVAEDIFLGTRPWMFLKKAIARSSSGEQQAQDVAVADPAQDVQRLWQKYFSDPSEWWDNRLGKNGPRSPDFAHKKTKEALWMDSRYKPPWVESQLANADTLRTMGNPRVWANSESQNGRGLVKFCKEEQLEMALDVMDQPSKVPAVGTYFHLLKACIKKKSLAEAKRVYDEMVKHGYESHSFLGESVVNTLVKCGSLEDALQVFHRLSQRTAFSWTAIISGYVSLGRPHEALDMFQKMQEEGVRPDSFTFVSVVKACSSVGDLEQGKQMHAQVRRYNCDSDLHVGNTLVHMYAQCGSMVDAWHLFNTLPERNVVSWNAMLAGYAKQEHADKALRLFYQMQKEDVMPNARTFVSVIKACACVGEREESTTVQSETLKLGALQEGKSIHQQAVAKGYGSDLFVGNTLAHMYATCGSLVDAQHVFDTLPKKDVVSWNSLLAGYAEQKRVEQAWQLYARMEEEGVQPNDRTFVGVLHASATFADMEDSICVDGRFIKMTSLWRGKAVHNKATRMGYASDQFVGNVLVHMYARCGSLVDAQLVFDTLPRRDVVSWNAMISGSVQQQQGDRALDLYAQMCKSGTRPDVWTFTCVLKACASLAESGECTVVDGQSVKRVLLQKGKDIHAEAVRRGYGSDLFIGNTLVHMYAKCGGMVEAWQVFVNLPERNVISWNAMIAGYSQQQQGEKALQLYTQMLEEGVSPDVWTFSTVLTACASLADVEESTLHNGQPMKAKSLQEGKAIHAEVMRKGYASDVFVGSTLVVMYAKCGSVIDAQHVFDTLPNRDVVTWNTILGCYVEQEQGEKALQLYTIMQKEGVQPDAASFLWILKACSHTGALEVCTQIHKHIKESKHRGSITVSTALVHAYCKCGSMVDAQYVFDALPERDVVAWTALMAGYARQGDSEKCIECFEKMSRSGIKPTGVTFLSLLSACSHAGMVEEGEQYFAAMERDYGITATSDHYSSMIDLFGRAGLFSKAEALLLDMPIQPDSAVWSTLLGVCRNHGNVGLGRHAFECLVLLQPLEASPYMLMSQIYANAGMWDSATAIDELRQSAGVWKTPGQSWIEYDQEVVTFIAGDRRHAQTEKVYAMLEHVSSRLKEAGLSIF